MKVKVFGAGAAGNKAVIQAINDGVIDMRDACLINSTEKDIPDEYREISVIIGSVRGAGKESKLGMAMMNAALDNPDSELMQLLPDFLEEDDQAVVIAHSGEGGTGCGAGPELGRFIKEQTGIAVHEYTFMGFKADARGLINTVDLFKRLDEEYIVHAICNEKFLDEAKGNRLRAEQLANKEFSKQLRVLTGSILNPCEQNMDDTDHFKLMNNPGYTMIETANIDRGIKTTEQLNELLVNTIRNSKSIDPESPVCRRIGVIWSVNDETRNIIDYKYRAIKDVVGEPFETFDHIQESLDGTQTVTIIIAGLKLPISEIQDIYDKYKELSSRVDRSNDDFYSKLGELDTDDDAFDVTTVTKKTAFFNRKRPVQPVQQSNAETSMQAVLVKKSE